MSKMLKAYEKLNRYPFGNVVFSKAVSWKAPYFKTIKPVFQNLKAGYSHITMKNRRAVQNHLYSVHAGAMCNLAELTAGSALDTALPGNMRWIPKSMDVFYKKMAKTDLTATAEVNSHSLNKPQDLPVQVHVKDENGVEVFKAIVNMKISEKKKR